MTMTVMFCGAALVCAAGGAFAGMALGSAPMLDRPAYGTSYQTHDNGGASPALERGAPDHYPLVTRQGTVPVDRLSERGLFSQARYRLAYSDAPGGSSYPAASGDQVAGGGDLNGADGPPPAPSAAPRLPGIPTAGAEAGATDMRPTIAMR